VFGQSQQITRFLVVDLPRVYTTFFQESRAVREFQERSTRVQTEVNRLNAEILELRSRHADAVLADNQTEALRLENLINRRSDFLREYYQTKTAELETIRGRLMQSGSFMSQVYDEIRYIAESEGCSLVSNLKDTPGIVWYSQTVDITDRLIQSLRTRSR
jgi:outer membrane protein